MTTPIRFKFAGSSELHRVFVDNKGLDVIGLRQAIKKYQHDLSGRDTINDKVTVYRNPEDAEKQQNVLGDLDAVSETIQYVVVYVESMKTNASSTVGFNVQGSSIYVPRHIIEKSEILTSIIKGDFPVEMMDGLPYISAVPHHEFGIIVSALELRKSVPRRLQDYVKYLGLEETLSIDPSLCSEVASHVSGGRFEGKGVACLIDVSSSSETARSDIVKAMIGLNRKDGFSTLSGTVEWCTEPDKLLLRVYLKNREATSFMSPHWHQWVIDAVSQALDSSVVTARHEFLIDVNDIPHSWALKGEAKRSGNLSYGEVRHHFDSAL